MEGILITVAQIMAGFMIGRGLGGLMNAYSKPKMMCIEYTDA
jgi:hypothetical protein